jgi:hypothetical protein
LARRSADRTIAFITRILPDAVPLSRRAAAPGARVATRSRIPPKEPAVRPITVALLPALLLPPVALSSRAPQDRPPHPRLLFDAADLERIRARSTSPPLETIRRQLLARAGHALNAPPIVPSTTKRGEPDPPGESKGIASARALQGRALSLAMAFLLTGDARYRDTAVALLDDALTSWRIWVDTAHQPPYDLMTGENALTVGLVYDWLSRHLTEAERTRLRAGAERRALQPYLDAVERAKPMGWHSARHNWNTVCNGGATVLALALLDESPLAARVLEKAAPAMAPYWAHLGEDGAWDEGTGYWTYGHRYGLIAAEALRRAGRDEGRAVFAHPGVARTGYFPMVFNPGRTLSASFGDSGGRASDPVFYLLAREYANPDFAWFQDRATLRPVEGEGWPGEALALVWRGAGEPWLPESRQAFAPRLDPTQVFPSIGWAMLADRQPDPTRFVAFKNGSLAANHTHLDLNHVSVGLGDAMILRELNSRPYPADYFGPARYGYYELSTAGHNTVLVGGRGQVHGRQGRLSAPEIGPHHVALVGTADGAYEIETPHARRHIVFVDARYWLILDEIATAADHAIETRWHTYGNVETRADGWIVRDGDAAIAVLVPQAGVTRAIDRPTGWIREVTVLRTMAPAARAHAIVTVLAPMAGEAPPPLVQWRAAAGTIDVTVGRDRLRFERRARGLALDAVSIGGGRTSQP